MIVLLNLFKIIKYYVIKLWTLAIFNVFYSIFISGTYYNTKK
jgi:hypothetical protein